MQDSTPTILMAGLMGTSLLVYEALVWMSNGAASMTCERGMAMLMTQETGKPQA